MIAITSSPAQYILKASNIIRTAVTVLSILLLFLQVSKSLIRDQEP